jgi:ornithine cyclodeaminase
MNLPYLDAAQIETLVPMPDAVAALEKALLSGAAPGDAPPRFFADIDAGELLVMPAANADGVGIKLITITGPAVDPSIPRIQGVYVLFDAKTLAPAALLDGIALTNLRTPAVSAVATARCAAPDASVLTIFGTGPQSWGHVLAMQAVRPITQVRIVGRRAEAVNDLVTRIREHGLEAKAAGPEAVEGADIICACTTAREPLFDGRLLAEHAHVNAIGSHYVDGREVDTETVRRSAVVVETREAAFREAGDILVPIAEGAVDESVVVADLAELVTGKVTVDPARPTMFKSIGMAWEDLAVAVEALARHAD